MPAQQVLNVVFTLNNPTNPIPFDVEKMHYLVYQEEVGASGTRHYQGYCEFKTKKTWFAAKQLLGGNPHVEKRQGTAVQAIQYCKKDATRAAHCSPIEFGEPNSTQQGKRSDLEAFAADIKDGKRKRELIEDHLTVIAKYPKLYDTLNSKRPVREETVQVTLLIGGTGLGKTRFVYDLYQQSEDLYIAPLSNGTMWYDTYDGHKYVLIDDFAGAASHMTLTCLLALLDRYPSLVPTKGSHTWFYPTHIYVTTNIMPQDWYKWDKRGAQYLALERRFSRTLLFYKGEDTREAPAGWWRENCPSEAHHHYPMIAPVILN